MRLLIRLSLFALAPALAACDVFPSTPAPTFSDEELPAFRFGTVFWEGVDTDCADGAWLQNETGTAIVEGDQITLWFETVPELSGTLTGDTAQIGGSMTFPGDTGATVSCVVTGNATVQPAEIGGEMTERLSSEGDVNCRSSGRYRMVFDD